MQTSLSTEEKKVETCDTGTREVAHCFLLNREKRRLYVYFVSVWDTADVKGEEGRSIEGATVSDYIHNQDE
jgi:hypothetical protein